MKEIKLPEVGKWTFNDKSIALGFDNHVNEQLPWYGLATSIVEHIVKHYLPENGVLYDIGCSTGNITKSLSEIIEHRKVTAISLDSSKEMCEQFKGVGSIHHGKAENFNYSNFDCAILFLTLMFIPIKERKPLIDNLFSKLNKGGCIIIFDKIMPNSGYQSIINSRLALAEKMKNGVPCKDIIDKELSLSGVQRPINQEIYGGYDLIFKYGDFVGFIIEK